MATKLTSSNFSTATVSTFIGTTITGVTVTDGSYNPNGATAVALSGGYIKITGTNFISGASVYLDSTTATSVTYVSSTQLNVAVPALATGTYIIYVINGDGTIAIRVPGLTYSSTPNWVTGNTLSLNTGLISYQLVASSDSAITYSLYAGSTLPFGLSLSSTGLLTGTLTTAETTVYNFTVIAVDTETQTSIQSFAVTIVVLDAYFNLTTLALNAEGPSYAALIPWTKDSSPNNFQLAVNNITRPSNFSPYNSSWSNFFNGSTDYLSFSPGAAFAFGTGAFTVEAWVNLNVTPTANYILDARNSGQTSNWAFGFGLGTSARLGFYDSSTTLEQSSTTVSANGWYHCVAVRSGTTLSVFINGTRVATGTNSTNLSTSPTTSYIGAQYNGANYMNGYLSNVRVVKGTAVYDPTQSTITVPTSALTAITNTSLLTCQSNRFVDNSTNNYTITTSGTPTANGFGPILETDLITGSAYFSGTGDYLTIASNAAFAFAAGDFTVEMWVYPSTVSAVGYLFDTRTVNTNPGIQWYINSNATMGVAVGTTNVLTTAAVMTTTQWQHIALVKQSGIWAIYRNGVQLTAGANATSLTDNALVIGTSFNNQAATTTDKYTGYISNLRIVKGTAVYGTTFNNLPTAVFPNSGASDSYFNVTTLLLHGDSLNGSTWITDASTNNFAITSVGDAKASSITPFSTSWSVVFNGTTDYLTVPYNASFTIPRIGNFTVEAWIFVAGGSGSQREIVVRHNPGSSLNWMLELTAGNAISFYFNGTSGGESISSDATVPLSQWVHVAGGINGVNKFICLNGVYKTAAYTSAPNASSTLPIAIGATQTGTLLFTGIISNVRVVNGTAVYTATYTPSSSPLTAITNTVLLTCQSNYFKDNSTNNATLTVGGTPSVQYNNPFGTSLTGASGYYDGTGDYLTIPDNTAFDMGSGNFTVEFWFYATSAKNTSFFTKRASNASFAPIMVQFTTSATLILYLSTSGSAWAVNATSAATTINTWHHVAMVRNGTTVVLFLDGAVVASGTASGAVMTNASAFVIGADDSAGNNGFAGYIANFRLVKGIAVYGVGFDLQSAAFPDSGTSDSYFNYTTLLLHGERLYAGANGNDTFLDSSTTSATITPAGNSSQGTFTPFSQTGWSNYFDGADDDLSIASSANLTPAAGDFTLECWIFPTSWASLGSYRGVIGGPVSGCMYFGQTSTGFGLRALATADVVVTTTLPPTNVWTHVAVSRSGTSARLFINGILTSTATDSTNFAQTQVVIANTSVAGTEDYAGYISNLRFIKGTAIYTSSFTPSTTPLTAVTNTQLLTCQSNRFIDNSTNAFSLSVGGTPSVQAFSPFLPTTTYSATTIGGSVYLDGSGDYLDVAQNAAFGFGTGDFSVEVWHYSTNLTVNNTILDTRLSSGTGAGWVLNAFANGGVNFYTGVDRTSTTGIVKANTWNHYVVTRSGTTLRIFINGVLQGYFTGISTDFGASNPLRVGYQQDNNNYCYGYVSSVRLVKGSIPTTYQTASTTTGTAVFASPTAPATTTSQGSSATSLLLNFTNTAFVDHTSKNVLETVGNPDLGNLQKFGSRSILFNGTTDYLTIPNTQNLNFGSGDFTVELWVYANTASVAQEIIQLNPNPDQSSYAGLRIVIESSTFKYYLSTTGGSPWSYSGGTVTVTASTWYHIALVRSGATVTFYINGVSNATSSVSTNSLYFGSAPSRIGNVLYSGGNNYFNGNIDELRITRGIARYTTAYFAVPSAPLTATQSAYTSGNTTGTAITGTATSLLTLQNAQPTQNSSFTDGSQNNFAITRNGDVTQGTFTPFSQTGWSNYFSAGYLRTTSSTALGLSTNPFTIEAWVYVTDRAAQYWVVGGQASTQVYIHTDGTLIFSIPGVRSLAASTATVPLNTWTHVAYVRSSTGTNGFAYYINGVQSGIDTLADDLGTASAGVEVGRTNNGVGVTAFTGYISNVRVVKDTAVYTSSFTPSTQPLTAIAGTSLLTCQSNQFIDNSASNATFTTSAASVQAFSPLQPSITTPATYSVYLGGNGNYLTPAAGNAVYNPGATGEWTLECWIYPITSGAFYGVGGGGSYANSIACYWGSGTLKFTFLQGNGSSNPVNIVQSTTSPAGAWYHYAVSKDSSNVIRLFINGVQVGTQTYSSAITGGNRPVINGVNDTNGLGNDGTTSYISNLRWVKGGCLYPNSAGFTPSTVPLTTTVSSGTCYLLFAQSSTLTDVSNTSTFVATGTVRPVASPSPFSPTVTLNPTYSVATVGGSAYFDGTGDFLSVPDNAALEPSSSVCCFEFWYYPTSISAVASLLSKRANSAANGSLVLIRGAGSSSVLVYLSSTGSGWDIASGVSMGSVVLNQWNHLALYRISNTWYGAMNGVVTTVVASNSAAIFNGSTSWYIGAESDGQSTAGYLSGNRIVIGSSVYTAGNFALPIAPVTAVTNTNLLLNYTNLAIYDNTAKNNLQTVGNAQISTVQSKWGGSSLYFDGTGDYLDALNGQNFVFGTGDFTIEFWLYTSATSFGLIGLTGGTTGYWQLNVVSSTMYWQSARSTTNLLSAGATAILNGAWHHIAVIRSSGTTRLYFDGTFQASAADSTNYNGSAGMCRIGLDHNSVSLTGYMDDIRITKGYARYTTPYFIVPTTALSTTQSGGTSGNVTTTQLLAANTSLLTLQNRQGSNNNAFLDSSTNKFLVTRNGTPTQGTFTPFSITGWSMYLPGSGSSYVQTPASSLNNLIGGQLSTTSVFTIECFLNIPAGMFVVGDCDPTSGTANLILGVNSDGTLSLGATFGGYTTRNGTGAISFNTWNHVAWVVNLGTVYFYVNGVPAGSAAIGNAASAFGRLIFGGYNNSFTNSGYFSNFRITKSAVYNSAFTVPTQPLTAIPNTTLLTFQNNNFKDNSASNYTLNTNGTPSVQSFSPFVPTITTPATYSAYMTTGYLTTAANAGFALSGDFTIECWVYSSDFSLDSTTRRRLFHTGGGDIVNSLQLLLGTSAGNSAVISVLNNGWLIDGTINVVNSTWNHVAVTRSGSSLKLFVNGVQSGSTATTAQNFNSGTSNTVYIGANSAGNGIWQGLISNLRVINGTAVYASVFTPPTAPFATNTTNQQLLVFQTNTLTDSNTATTAKAMTAAGNIQPVTSPVPFNPTYSSGPYSTSLVGGSMYLNGSTDYLSIASSLAFGYGTGDFSLEFWAYPAALSDNNRVIFHVGDDFNLELIGSGYMQFFSGTARTSNPYTYKANAWTHCCATRQSGTVRMFINGQLTNNFALASSKAASAVQIGSYSTSYFNGTLSNVRIVKGGVPRLYSTTSTTNGVYVFIPPTAPFNGSESLTSGAVSLILNGTNGAIIDQTGKTNLVTVGDAKITSVVYKYNNSSMYFDGTGDYLSYGGSVTGSVVDISAGNFTLEAWVYLNVAPSTYAQTIYQWFITAGTSNSTITFVIHNTAGLRFICNNSGGTTLVNCSQGSTTGWSTGVWYHVAAVRTGDVYTVYRDGISLATTTVSGSLAPTTSLRIGSSNFNTANEGFNGYLDDIRITKGFARYIANFSAPSQILLQ